VNLVPFTSIGHYPVASVPLSTDTILISSFLHTQKTNMVRTKVFVGNLSFQTKEAELATEFGTAGKVISANIITRGPRSLGYGFVEMDSEADAENAVKLMNKKDINGRPINVEIAKPQDETKEKQPRQPKPEGENDEARRRPRKKTGRKKEGEGADAAEGGEAEKGENEGKKEEGEKRRRPRNRRARRDSPGEKRVSNEEKEESKTTLFVANLPFSLDDEGFAKIVTDLGLKLKAAHVVKKRNGRSKGYGFIEFDAEEDQKKSLEALNKKSVENRELSVKVALTEVHREEESEEKKSEKTVKPAEKKAVPAEKKAVPAEKKAVPAEKKAVPAEKKVGSPAEKKAVPAEKKAVPAEKKAVPAEKKVGSPSEKKTASPAAPASPADKKTPTPEKKA